jgi:hypothetical protein
MASVRQSMKDVLRSLFHYKIIMPILGVALYTAAIVRVMAAIYLWEISLLKDTIVWFFACALVFVARYVTSKDNDNIFQKVITESVTLIVILEFLANTYTFPLLAELVIIPVLTLIGMTNAYASVHEEHAKVEKFTKGLLTIAGLVILANAVMRAVADFHNLGSMDTIRSIALAPLLSTLFTPFLYLLVLASNYEQLFIRLNIGAEKSKEVKRYARRQIIKYVGLRMSRLYHLLRNHAFDLMRVQTNDDVDRLLAQAIIPSTQSTGEERLTSDRITYP